jgi:signal transduction histidine kinase
VQPASNSQRERTQLLLAAGAVVTVGLCLVPVLVAADPDASPSPTPTLIQVLTIAVPAIAGLYGLRSEATRRYGALLLLVGWGWTLTALSRSPDDLLYSAGRVSAWLMTVAVAFTMLAFPRGRLIERSARWLFAALIVLLLVGFLPTALLVDRYPVPSPWEDCLVGCPHNAFQLTGHQPGITGAQGSRVRDLVLVLLAAGVPFVLATRMRRSTPATRRTLRPVIVASSAFAIAWAAFGATRAADPGSQATKVAAVLPVICVALIGAAFLLGLFRRRLFDVAALQRLVAVLARRPTRAELRGVLSEALGDPTLELWYADGSPGRWLDADARPVVPAVSADGRAVTTIEHNGRATAALVHDPGLLDDPNLMRAAGEIALASLENQRLTVALDASLHEVEESRLRIAAAADDARRRIEQDLHDGAQQRLMGLRVRLELAAERLQADPSLGALELRRLGDEVDLINEEVRSLARGIYPAALTDGGLAEALRAAALRAPLHVTVAADGIGRHPRPVEAAVYFACLEALQNATKHAGATRIRIDLGESDGLLRRGRRSWLRARRRLQRQRAGEHARSHRGRRRRARDPKSARTRHVHQRHDRVGLTQPQPST